MERRARALGAQTGFPFEAALRGKDIAFICEVKKASPSKGVIALEFPYRQIALDYEAAGAAAVSVLTEPAYFQGADAYLSVGIPVLRKDFTVDSYMIYEARTLGAAAVLLIAALLDGDTLRDYIGVAHSLGLSALVEAHTAEETEVAVKAGARIIGVNNRDLRTFQVDTGNCLRLRPLVPRSVLFVAESGVRTAADIDRLRAGGVDAVLVGETLMRAPDRKAALAALRGTP